MVLVSFEHPRVLVGTPEGYGAWRDKARTLFRESGRDPESLDRIDTTINYRQHRILLFHLADSRNETSAADTLSHEVLHSLLEQFGERWAARSLDLISKEPGDRDRVGGV